MPATLAPAQGAAGQDGDVAVDDAGGGAVAGAAEGGVVAHGDTAGGDEGAIHQHAAGINGGRAGVGIGSREGQGAGAVHGERGRGGDAVGGDAIDEIRTDSGRARIGGGEGKCPERAVLDRAAVDGDGAEILGGGAKAQGAAGHRQRGRAAADPVRTTDRQRAGVKGGQTGVAVTAIREGQSSSAILNQAAGAGDRSADRDV